VEKEEVKRSALFEFNLSPPELEERAGNRLREGGRKLKIESGDENRSLKGHSPDENLPRVIPIKSVCLPRAL